MTTIADFFGFGTSAAPFSSRTFLAGSEFEIEAIGENKVSSPRILVEPDHSLRNNGLEFKTLPGSFEDNCEYFKHIHSRLKLGKDPFSERTSIHVHVNCLSLTPVECRQMVLVYALLEPLFFNFVGPKRANNIFCVPLNYTSLPKFYAKDIGQMHKAWHKYTAFNISPLGPGKDGSAPHGTIEFRHMYGTNNFELYHRWLSALKGLYDFIVQNEGFDIIKYLETNGDIVSLAKQVVPSLLQNVHDFHIKEQLQDSVLDVKLSDGGLVK